jgi:multiple sugar transport system substrate-binding protein
MTAVRGGTGPDIYELDRFTVAQRAAAGVLTDLTPYIQKYDPNMSTQYIAYSWAETQFEGKTWALPFDSDSRGLWYNIDMLQKAGIDPSQLDPSHGPLTLDQVDAIAKKLDKTDSNGNYTQMGWVPTDTSYSQGWHYTWGFDFGGKFADLAACKVTPTDPGVMKAFQWMYNWNQSRGPQKVQTFLSTYNPPNNPTSQAPYFTGHVAMFVSGPWVIQQINQYAPNTKFGVTYIPVPAAGDKPSTWSGGWSVVIPKGAKNPDQAFQFMTWWTGAPGEKAYTVGTQHLPTYLPVYNDTSLYTGQLKFFRDLMSISNSRPPLPVGALYWDALTTAQNAVDLNSQTPEQALQQVYNQVQPQLQQYCPLQ